MPSALLVKQGTGAGSAYPVEHDLVVGRDASADLVLDDSGVSRAHARVRSVNGRVVIEDLDSSNGTFVNGERISGRVDLRPGDEVQLGDTVLELSGFGAAPARVQPRPIARQPHPMEDGNVPALAAVFLGPLSILLLVFSAGAAFFISLPSGIAAIVLGGIGKRKVDRGETRSGRGLASVGRICGIIGTILSAIALVAFILVAVLLETAEDSLSGLIDSVRDEIEGTDVDVPDVEAPEVESPEVQEPEVEPPQTSP
jgi:pSer/pThr/pTyr-binding forkhead associated (FHA) protein